jgi:hypothetical protein
VESNSAGVGTTRAYLAAAGYGTDKAIFGYGFNSSSQKVSITNLVSNTGVVDTDTTGVGTARMSLAAAGYGTDKAIFGYGTDAVTTYAITNLVSNLGIVATDTAGVGTPRAGPSAAGYGDDKAIFGYGQNSSGTRVAVTNLVSNTGVVAADQTAVTGSARIYPAAAGYGTFGQALFGYGSSNLTFYAVTNLVSNTGVVASDTAGVGTARQGPSAARYGGDKAIFGYGFIISPSSTTLSMTNLVSNTGVVASDTAGVGTARYQLAAAGYGSDKAIYAYGQTTSSPTTAVSITNLVTNTGIMGTDSTSVGTVRQILAAASYGSYV